MSAARQKPILHQGMPTKVSVTLVLKELQWFFLGFFGVEFDFQSIETMYNPIVGIIFGGQMGRIGPAAIQPNICLFVWIAAARRTGET